MNSKHAAAEVFAAWARWQGTRADASQADEERFMLAVAEEMHRGDYLTIEPDTERPVLTAKALTLFPLPAPGALAVARFRCKRSLRRSSEAARRARSRRSPVR